MGILGALFEKRVHPSNPDNWLLYALSGGPRSHAGIDVSEESAMNSTAVFAAIRILAETIASLPLHLYERQQPRGKRRAVDHPLYSILHIKPNPEMTSMAYREAIAGHVIAWGTSYSEIERNEGGAIKGLWPLLPGNMAMKRMNGELVYGYKLPDGGTKMFAADNILRVTGFSKNGLQGYQPIQKGREAIGLSLALEEFGARFFGNGAQPNTVLEHPEQLSKPAAERLKKAWEERHQGLSNSHRVAILEEGMKLKEFGISPEKAQALESRKFQIVEIARIFNIPPHMLKDLEKASFNNIEMMSLEFVIYTIRPWLVRFEQAYSMQLLTDNELRNLFFEHLIDGILRGDAKSRHEAYATGRQWGWYSANDIREMENKNPIDGGDTYLVPLNMIPADQAGDLAQPSKQEESKALEHRGKKLPVGRDRVAKAYYPLFIDAAQRIVNKEGLAIKRAIKKHLGQRNLTGLDDWINKFYGDLPKDIQKTMGPIIRSYAQEIQAMAADEIGSEPGMTPELEKFIDEYLGAYTARHIQSSIGQLQALIKNSDPEELENIIVQRTDEWQEKRPNKIAQREAVQVSNAITTMVFFGAGLAAVWRTRGKTCPYCLALEGRKINQGDYFVKPGDWKPEGTDAPMKIRGMKKHPPLHAGCFPGDSCVFASSGILGSSERWYDGNLAVIHTATGKKITCTPNHPIFTTHGWVAANKINKGDHVGKTVLPDFNSPIIRNGEDVPSFIKNISKTFVDSAQMVAVPVPVAPKDFHGDGADSEITIIRADGSLLRETNPGLFHELRKFNLALRDGGEGSFTSLGGFAEFIKTHYPANSGPVGSFDLMLSLVRGHFFPDSQSGLPAISGLDAIFNEILFDNISGNPKSVGNAKDRFSSDVLFDEVIGIENNRSFHGLVYNLHTESKRFYVDTIIVHNCDCYISAG